MAATGANFNSVTLSMIALVLLLLTGPACASDTGDGEGTPHNVGFYYGNEAPLGALYAFDWLILQPGSVSDTRLQMLRQGGTRPLAYLGVDEMSRDHQLLNEIPADWRIGDNPAWNSIVLDLRKPGVRQFLLSNIVTPAMNRGFQGVFLDTLDSHQLTEVGRRQPEAFAKAQAIFIASIREDFPGATIVANRGFHLPESIHPTIDGLAFESYRSSYRVTSGRYGPVPDSDRQWLDGKFEHWRQEHPDILLIAIDYTETLDEAADIAARLRQDGFVPYVTDGDLVRLGPTQPRMVPRHVLVIHDLPEDRMDESNAHRRLGIILERLGLVPEYHSSLSGMPREPINDRYLGIIAWWESGGRQDRACRWLDQAQDQGLPVVSLGLVDTTVACRKLMNVDRFVIPSDTLTYKTLATSMAAYEGRRLPARPVSRLPVTTGQKPWLSASDGEEEYTPVYLTDRGGVAVDPFLFESGPDNTALWLFDPFDFIQEALGLTDLPAIDSTTESGRRILTAHIDGDAFISRAEIPGTPLAAEVIYEQFLRRYTIPHTVSVVEGETSQEGLYPHSSTVAESLARRIFRLDNVEAASHSFSHPFFWGALEGSVKKTRISSPYGDYMSIPGYDFDLEREIAGSVNYVNRLTPDGKTTEVFLWSGDARPGPAALGLVRELGLPNVNGGNTKPLPYASELAGVWPDARPVGDQLQVYAPVMNENVYTNLWTGPFYGYRDVRDSFRILEDKGRLKPISIYYHFYSGTKPGSISALDDVYQYALDQEVTPLYLSEYASRVQTQYFSAMLQDEEGRYSWRGIRQPTTVRVPRDRFPDLENSRGVAGYHDAAGQRFVHLVGPKPALALSERSPSGPYVISANGPLTRWHRERQTDGSWQLTLSAEGHVPLDIHLAAVQSCRVTSRHGVESNGSNPVRLRLKKAVVQNLTLECR